MKYFIGQVIQGISFNTKVGNSTVIHNFNSIPLPNVSVTDIQIRTFRCINKHISDTDYLVKDRIVVGYSFVDDNDNLFGIQYPQAIDLLVNKASGYLLKRDVFEDNAFVRTEIFADIDVFLKKLKANIYRLYLNKQRNALSFNDYTERVLTHRIDLYRNIMSKYQGCPDDDVVVLNEAEEIVD